MSGSPLKQKEELWRKALFGSWSLFAVAIIGLLASSVFNVVRGTQFLFLLAIGSAGFGLFVGYVHRAAFINLQINEGLDRAAAEALWRSRFSGMDGP